MEDGARHLTDYQSSTRRNEYIKYINDIWRDDQYRLFLQLNGKEIMNKEWAYNKKNNSCFVNDCVHNYPTRMSPAKFPQEREAYNSIYDLRTNKQLEPLRRCAPMKDFRMTSDTQ